MGTVFGGGGGCRVWQVQFLEGGKAGEGGRGRLRECVTGDVGESEVGQAA